MTLRWLIHNFCGEVAYTLYFRATSAYTKSEATRDGTHEPIKLEDENQMDNIFGNHFAERNNVAWHVKGVRLEGEAEDVTTGMRKAGMLYEIERRRLYYVGADGQQHATSHVALVRPAIDGETGPAMLGIATDEYTPLQNHELAKMLDPLTHQWPLETVGALGRGETTFLTLNGGHTKIGGDDIRVYLFAFNTHDGSTAFKMSITPVRVVCQNTCVTGLRQAYVTADVNHTRRIHQEAKFAVQLITDLRKAQDTALAALDDICHISLSSDQIRRILDATYPDRPEPIKLAQLEELTVPDGIELPDEKVAEVARLRINYEDTKLRNQRLRVAAVRCLYDFNVDRPKLANTGWAVYNAITSLEGYRKGGNDQQRIKSVLIGPRGETMSRAFAAIRQAGGLDTEQVSVDESAGSLAGLR